MISHKTHAVAGAPDQPGQEAQKQYILFDANSSSNFSATFDVNQAPWYLQAFNLAENDIVYVQMASGSGSGVLFSNMYQFGGAVQLNALKNKLRIDLPGRYRLSFSGASVQAIKVTGFPATMTQESNSGFAEALTEIVNTLYTSVIAIEGTSPITVTGGGGILDPYVIGIDPAEVGDLVAVTGTNPITVAGDGSSGDPYVIGMNNTSVPAPGSDTQVVFNDGGVLAGAAQVTWNETTKLITLTTGASLDISGAITQDGTGLGRALYIRPTVSNSGSVDYIAAQIDITLAAAANFANGVVGLNLGDIKPGAGGSMLYGRALNMNVSIDGVNTLYNLYCSGDAPSKFGGQGIVLEPLASATPHASVMQDGLIWYDDVAKALKVRINGVTKTVTVS